MYRWLWPLLLFGLIGYPAYGCEKPDPASRPVVRLAAGELRQLAVVAWGEARSDGHCAMQAVAAVILNRLQANPKLYGATITQVVHKPFAFSVFGRRDPNRVKMGKADESDPSFISAMLAAIAAVGGSDPTGGATHFAVAGSRPAWATRMVLTARIGAHAFYRSAE